jgi:hypothetical protein
MFLSNYYLVCGLYVHFDIKIIFTERVHRIGLLLGRPRVSFNRHTTYKAWSTPINLMKYNHVTSPTLYWYMFTINLATWWRRHTLVSIKSFTQH